MSFRFDRKSALITGAASGIGRATAIALAKGGCARLILVDQNQAGLDSLSPVLGVETQQLAGDVADPALWEAFDPAELNLAVINAGISAAGLITEMSFTEWRRVLGVNLDGAFLSLQASLRAMREGGSIVMVSSATGLKAETGTAAYGSAKAGLLQLMRVAAKESAARRIRVNAIAPAGVETPMWSSMDFFEERCAALGSEAAVYEEMAKAGTPLGRFASADEIATQIAFLLSEAAATITGATLTSDGGYLL